MSKSFLDINPDALDEEWVNQPNLYMEYSERLAEAQRVLDNAKTRYDVIFSKIDRVVRKKLAGDKATEAKIASRVRLHPKVRDADKAVTDANFEVNIARGAVTALEHRKRALTMLVELHLSNYFSEPATVSKKQVRDGMLMRGAVKRTVGKLKSKLNREDQDDTD